MFILEPLDWYIFRAAIIAFWSGHNPYLTGSDWRLFFGPIWTLVLLSPFALLPPSIQSLAMAAVGFIVMWAVCYRLRLSLVSTFCVCLSVYLLFSMSLGNIEWLPWAGLLMPLPLGMMFLFLKPQATVGVMVVLLLRRYKAKGLNGLLTAVVPTGMGLLIQLALYGYNLPPASHPLSESFFPWSLLVGVPILILAILKDNERIGAVASPFLAPYAMITAAFSFSFAFPVEAFLAGWGFGIFKMVIK